MIDNLATKVSRTLVDRFPNELPPFGITRYGIKFILSNLVPLLSLLLIGWILDTVYEIIVCYVSFASLRMVSGGYHAKMPEVCLIISTALITLIAKFGHIMIEYVHILNLVSLALVIIYAPSNIENQTKILKSNFKFLKLISIMIVLVGFVLNDVLVSASLLVQSLLLIRLKGGEKIDQN